MSYKVFIGLGLLFLGVMIFFFMHGNPDSPLIREDDTAMTPAPEKLQEAKPADVAAETDPLNLSAEYLSSHGDPQVTPRQRMVEILEVLDSFNHYLKGRTELSRLGNQELVEALLGANNDGIQFVSPDSPALNERDELVDHWRTPYFFHFEHSAIPEIRSAGPDRRMWTDDDLLLKPF